MSTSSGALIATATVFDQDILGKLRGHVTQNDDHAGDSRWLVAGFGVVMIAIACLLQDVVAALTVAYDILVGGLLVPILGGFLWKRATGVGALSAMAAGTAVTLGTMVIFGVAANEPIYYGLAASLIAYVVGSLLTSRTPANVLQVWDDRLAGRDAFDVEPLDTASQT
jgi:SSS family solute:Na+ symporter